VVVTFKATSRLGSALTYQQGADVQPTELSITCRNKAEMHSVRLFILHRGYFISEF
jgi:hypothetical protein